MAGEIFGLPLLCEQTVWNRTLGTGEGSLWKQALINSTMACHKNSSEGKGSPAAKNELQKLYGQLPSFDNAVAMQVIEAWRSMAAGDECLPLTHLTARSDRTLSPLPRTMRLSRPLYLPHGTRASCAAVLSMIDCRNDAVLRNECSLC